MKKEDIYIGNVLIGKYNSNKENEIINNVKLSQKALYKGKIINYNIYSSCVPLYEVDFETYINLQWLNTPSKYLKLYKALLTKNFDDPFFIKTYPSDENNLFISKDMIEPYYDDNLSKHITSSKVRSDMLIDPRVPDGLYDGNPRRSYPTKKRY